jgi:hypothetical protein
MQSREADNNKLKKDKMRKSKKTWNKKSLVSFGRSEVRSFKSLSNKKRKRRESEVRSLKLTTEDKWI